MLFLSNCFGGKVRSTSSFGGVMAALVVQQTKYAYTINGAVWRQRQRPRGHRWWATGSTGALARG